MMKITKNLIVALFIILSILFMIIETDDIMYGVQNAIKLWATRVFPVLFPFYIFSALAVKYGVAHLLGDLLKPITRCLFRTSSISGFVFFMSIISGNPSSAIIISQLYEDGSITKTEAQHLLSFCVFVNPIFCIGTIGYAYFHNVTIGYIVLISHIMANIIIGLLMRYQIKNKYIEHFSFKNAYLKMVRHKNKHNTTFGETITTILQNGMNTMFLIGGFMIFYNLIIVMIINSQIIHYSYHYLSYLLMLFNIHYETYYAFFVGIFEMVLGVDTVIQSTFSLRLTTTFVTMLISFGGLSIHSQIQSILLKVKLKYFPFFISRIAQMVFSGVISFYLFPFLYNEKTIHTIYLFSYTTKDKTIVLLSIIILSICLLTIINHRIVKKRTLS